MSYFMFCPLVIIKLVRRFSMYKLKKIKANIVIVCIAKRQISLLLKIMRKVEINENEFQCRMKLRKYTK